MPSPSAMDSTKDTKTDNPAAVEKHAEYYFEDLIFLVENQLFKVPRRSFANGSEVFSDMFKLPSVHVEDQKVDGSSDDQPLHLEGIKKFDFVQLLRVMFSDLQDSEGLTLEEWTSVLRLSTMWQFFKIRNTAIRNMEKLEIDLVDKIIIARQFDVSVWLVPTLNALIQRQRPLNLSEGNRLGMEWVLKVAEVREQDATVGTPSSQSRTCSHCGYTGAARCGSCNYTGNPTCGSCGNTTPAARCGSCNQSFSQTAGTVGTRGNRSSIDYSGKVREIFGLL